MVSVRLLSKQSLKLFQVPSVPPATMLEAEHERLDLNTDGADR
jgi:hypothetical protein